MSFRKCSACGYIPPRPIHCAHCDASGSMKETKDQVELAAEERVKLLEELWDAVIAQSVDDNHFKCNTTDNKCRLCKVLVALKAWKAPALGISFESVTT